MVVCLLYNLEVVRSTPGQGARRNFLYRFLSYYYGGAWCQDYYRWSPRAKPQNRQTIASTLTILMHTKNNKHIFLHTAVISIFYVGLITPGHPRTPQDTPGHPRIPQDTPKIPEDIFNFLYNSFIYSFKKWHLILFIFRYIASKRSY